MRICLVSARVSIAVKASVSGLGAIKIEPMICLNRTFENWV